MAPAARAAKITVASNYVIDYVVVTRPTDASRNVVQVQVETGLPGDVVIGTGGVPTDANGSKEISVCVI